MFFSRKGASIIIEKVYMHSLCKLMLRLWLEVAHDERTTKEYFVKLEQGENEDEGENLLENTGDFE